MRWAARFAGPSGPPSVPARRLVPCLRRSGATGTTEPLGVASTQRRGRKAEARPPRVRSTRGDFANLPYKALPQSPSPPTSSSSPVSTTDFLHRLLRLISGSGGPEDVRREMRRAAAVRRRHLQYLPRPVPGTPSPPPPSSLRGGGFSFLHAVLRLPPRFPLVFLVRM